MMDYRQNELFRENLMGLTNLTVCTVTLDSLVIYQIFLPCARGFFTDSDKGRQCMSAIRIFNTTISLPMQTDKSLEIAEKLLEDFETGLL